MNNTAQNIPRMTAEEYFKNTAETTRPVRIWEGKLCITITELEIL